ncbi:Formyltransferase [Pluteus cervinus]|uniref:Formyltransferase n=1 Tax=Pluteus cervinus TaxID=181527 RepID=A0ACD3AP74_9AGAR|nr:Formyltransferase [Pluteus cervinus]
MPLVLKPPFSHFNLKLSGYLTRSRGLPGLYRCRILSRSGHSRGYHTEFTDPKTQPPTLTRSVIIPGDEKFKVLFMGRDEFSCLVLKELHNASDVWEQLHIATQPDDRVGRNGSQVSVSPLKILGQTLDLPIHEIPAKKADFRHWKPPQPFYPLPKPSIEIDLLQIPPTHIIITASFGRILSAPLLNLFSPTRRLNVHPSSLPAYRGAAPIQHAIMNGDKETGVCVIEMLKRKEGGIDSGSIWGKAGVPMKEGTGFGEARDMLGVEGGRLLVKVMREMIAGTAAAISQERDPAALLAPMINASHWTIHFDQMSAEDIVLRHLAISHQRPLTTSLSNKKSVQLHSPSIFRTADTGVPEPLHHLAPGYAIFHKPTKAMLVRCAGDSILSVPQVKMEGKSLVPAREWWNGMKGLGLVGVEEPGVLRLGGQADDEGGYGAELLELAGAVGKVVA